MRILRFAALFPCLFLAGCSLAPTAGPSLDTVPEALHGTLFGGQQPVSGASVSIYEVGSTSYGTASATPKATTTTGANGGFAFGGSGATYTCTASNTPMYIVASGGTPGGYSANASLALMALIPQCGAGQSSTLYINEVTTAAAVLAAGQFMGTALGVSGAVPQIGATCTGCAAGTYNKGLVAAFSNTYPALVINATGNVAASTATKTIESAKIYTIANILASCVNSNGATSTTETTSGCGKLFTGVNAKSASPRAYTTIQAALEMVLYPYYNVSTVYGLGLPTSPYVGLGSAPNDWTVAIAYTSSTLALGISGTSTSRTSSNIDIDASGNIWFPSNAASAHGLGVFYPASQTFAGPYATTLVSPQYVTVDPSGNVWGTDLSTSQIADTSSTSPSTTAATTYTTAGPTGPIRVNVGPTPTSPLSSLSFGIGNLMYGEYSGTVYGGNENYTYNITGIAIFPSAGAGSPPTVYADAAVSGSSTACKYASGDYGPSGSGTAAIEATSASPCFSGDDINLPGLADELMTASSLNQVCDYGMGAGSGTCFAPAGPALSIPEGLALDGKSNIWFANSGNASVSTIGYAFSSGTSTDYKATATVAYLHNSTYGNTLTTPFGIAIDASGNVWVSNASCVNTGSGCTPSGFTLTEIVGAAGPTVTPLGAQSLANNGNTYTGGGFRPTN